MSGPVVTMDGYATHQKPLVRYALKASRGDTIVELGCGFYSTPILAEIARALELTYKVYFSDKDWQQHIAPHVDNVIWFPVDDWAAWEIREDVHMVLLDNEELVVNRYRHIERSLKKHARFIVVHDADIYPKRGVPLQGVHLGTLFDRLTPNTYVIDCGDDLDREITAFVDKTLKESDVPSTATPNNLATWPKSPTAPQHPGLPVFRVSNGTDRKPTVIKQPPATGVIRNGSTPTHGIVGIIKNGKGGPKASGMPIAPVARALHPSKIPTLQVPPPANDWVPRTAVVCAFTPGGDYDAHYEEYIERLRAGVQENTTGDVAFHCVSPMVIETEGVRYIEPLIKTWKGWHIKAECFREELWAGYDRVLYIDLDTQITANIDDILRSPERCMMLRDFYKPAVWETGMMYFTPRDIRGLYDAFCSLRPGKGTKDAHIIADFLRKRRIPPAFFQDAHAVGSYKVDLIRDKKPVDAYSVVCYHGSPRPHEVDWDLERQPPQLTSPGTSPAAMPSLLNKVFVPKNWTDQDVFIIGGGPSIKNIDLDKLLTDQAVLGINDGYLYDCCDICFFGDTIWHSKHKAALEEWGKPAYSSAGVFDPRIKYVVPVPQGLTTDLDKVGWNSNSGFAGMNLALNMGAKRIFLLGFDMDFGKQGEPNWHRNIRKVAPNSYDCFLKHQAVIHRDFERHFGDREIFCCIAPGYDTRITIFPKVPLGKLFGIPDEALFIKDTTGEQQ